MCVSVCLSAYLTCNLLVMICVRPHRRKLEVAGRVPLKFGVCVGGGQNFIYAQVHMLTCMYIMHVSAHIFDKRFDLYDM